MKKTAVLLLLMPLLMAVPSISFGEMHDGNILLDDCKQFLNYMRNKEDPSVAMSSLGYCLGYIQGHIDFLQYLKKNVASDINYCDPVDVNVSQLSKITVNYLEKNPDKLSKPAIELTLAAFTEAFPCNESRTSK